MNDAHQSFDSSSPPKKPFPFISREMDFHGCELARPLVSEAQAEANGLEVHVQAGEIWKLPRGLLSRSLLLRKLAEWHQGRDSFVVRPRCANTLRCLRATFDWPRSPAEVTEWREACDFLLVTPTLSELAFVLTSASDAWLADACKLLKDCASCEALRLTRRLATYGCLEQILHSPELIWLAGYESYGDIAPPPQVAGKAQLMEALSRSLCCDALAASGSAMLDALPRLQQVEASDHLKLHGAFESVERLFIALTNTIQGSLQLLDNIAAIGKVFGPKTARHLVHRSLCSLYLAEGLGEVERCAMSLETCLSLQELYYDGWIDLSSLLPIQDKAAFLLPGLRGAREILTLEPSAAAVYKAACAKVPWLQAAMACPTALHLTGSFLCWCRSQEQPDGRPPPPSDVDLFCTAQKDLEEVTEHVELCMLDFAQRLWDSAHVAVERSAPNAHRRTLRVCFAQQLPDLARRGLELLPKYTLQCDIYVNSLTKVMQYHLPQVRCALYLRDGLPQLFMAPSAAIAWMTMLNIDYCAIKGAKTPCEIISKAWQWGFNICLAQQEAWLLLNYLRAMHPLLCMEAEMLRRPGRISPHSGAHGYPWQLSTSPEGMLVEP